MLRLSRTLCHWVSKRNEIISIKQRVTTGTTHNVYPLTQLHSLEVYLMGKHVPVLAKSTAVVVSLYTHGNLIEFRT